MKPTFEDALSEKLWTGYFKRVKRILKSLPQAVREELLLELEGHLAESFDQSPGDREPDRLQAALESIGDPEEFLRPLMADRLLEDASRTFSPRTILLAAVYNLSLGVFRFVMACVLGFGYLLAFMLVLSGLAKIVDPVHSGLFIKSNGIPVMGIVDNPELYSKNLFGLWYIPLSIAAAVLLYIGLTKCWRLLLRKGR